MVENVEHIVSGFSSKSEFTLRFPDNKSLTFEKAEQFMKGLANALGPYTELTVNSSKSILVKPILGKDMSPTGNHKIHRENDGVEGSIVAFYPYGSREYTAVVWSDFEFRRILSASTSDYFNGIRFNNISHYSNWGVKSDLMRFAKDYVEKWFRDDEGKEYC